MTSPHAVRERTVGRGAAGLVLALLLAPFLVLLTSGSASAVTVMCLPKADETACIASTMGSRSEPISGVDVILTAPDGTDQTVTTGDDGKWSFEVKEPGTYKVTADPKTLPDGFELENESVEVQVKSLGTTVGAIIQIRPEGYDASTSKTDEIIQSTVNGLRLGLLLALASVGLSLIYGTTGLSNFAHAEQVTLGGMMGYLFVNEWGLPLWLGGICVVAFCAFTGWGQDRVLWQPLRRRGLGLTQMMIVTIGLSLALQYTFQYLVGARTVRVVQDNPEV